MRVNSKAVLIAITVATTAFSSAQSAPNVTLGKLGQALESIKIYSRMSTKSRVYYSAKPYEYLIIRSTKDSNWIGVVMRTGVLGYAQADAIARLPYDVTTESAEKPTASGRDVGSSTSRGAIAQYGLRYQGTPYVWGGNDLNKGIDCSGFVKQLFGKIGVSLPRTASEQALVGKPIRNYEELQPGDRLYFWEKKRNKIGHTGIYLGNGYFVHSSRGKGGVSTDILTEKWQRILVAARR
ncbi:MAG: C40 family peptidase [Chthonomonas sp.]|nr:C40 family peptidase [Chthonomonas sp.]